LGGVISGVRTFADHGVELNEESGDVGSKVAGSGFFGGCLGCDVAEDLASKGLRESRRSAGPVRPRCGDLVWPWARGQQMADNEEQRAVF
jgi:hypothetical protein